jgi:hypothetical protein
LIHIAQLRIATFASYERSLYFLRRLPYFHMGFLWYTIFMNLPREFEGVVTTLTPKASSIYNQFTYIGGFNQIVVPTCDLEAFYFYFFKFRLVI